MVFAIFLNFLILTFKMCSSKYCIFFFFFFDYVSLNHAMDSKGNICGIASSNVISIKQPDGSYVDRTNVFDVTLDTKGNVATGGNAPKDLAKAKYGVFPRIASDVVAQLAEGKLPQNMKFTQICADKCPKAGDVMCSYQFLAKWEIELAKGKTGVELLASTSNPVDDKNVRIYKRTTSGVTRPMALKLPYLVENACRGFKSAADDNTKYKMCVDTFIHCDFTPAPSLPILGRCMPYLENSPKITTQRCIEPLTVTLCDPDNQTAWAPGSDSDFNTGCLLNADDSKFYTTRYQPKAVGDSFLLDKEGQENCVRMEEKKLQVSEVIPQMQYLQSLTAAAGTIAQYMGDIRTAWYVVLASGLAFPLAFSFLYTFVMRFCAGCMTWMALILFILFTIALGAVALLKGGAVSDSLLNAATAKIGNGTSISTIEISEDLALYYKIIGYVLLATSIMCICMCIFARKAIAGAIHIIKTAASALSHNFMLTLFPIVSFMGIAATGAVFLITGILLMTAGDITENAMASDANSTSAVGLAMAESYKPASLEGISTLKYMMFFDLFMFLWTTEFIQAIGIMVIGGTVSHWYFATSDGSVKPDPSHHGQSHPCCCSWWIAIRFHMGSAAFGSFIIAVIQMIRVALEYVSHEIRKQGGEKNCAMRFVLMITKCCLCCLEKCIRFLSKNAYIHTAIHGDAFCFASVRSYHLIFNNLLAFGATNTITSILMLVGKIMVCVASMLFGYVWVNYSATFNDPSKETYITSSLFISIAVLMLAYLVAESFFNVFHVTIDTILLAYCMVSQFVLCLFLFFLIFS